MYAFLRYEVVYSEDRFRVGFPKARFFGGDGKYSFTHYPPPGS